MTTAKDVLKRARKLIENRWTKDHYINQLKSGNCYCALGACMRAGQLLRAGYICPIESENDYFHPELNFYRQEDKNPAVVGAIKLLEKNLPEIYSNVASFNDDNRTTRKDILNLFDKAIKQA